VQDVTEIQYADGPAGPLSYLRRGEQGAPRLLLVMGVAGHHRMWGDPFLDALAGRFDVVALDNRGIGESHRAEPGFTVADMAADAVAVLDHVGWDAAHVCGISMGGVIAQELGLTHPDRVRSLVLGCTFPDPDAWGPAIGKLADAARSGDALTAARLMFEANVSPGFAATEGRLEEFAAAAGAVKVPGPVVMMQMHAAAVHDARDRLGSLDVPTLVVHGTEDEVILPGAGERLAALVPRARMAWVEGAGHLYFWERPQESARLVVEHALG
jgi:3-oxoadipate enol-lactonase